MGMARPYEPIRRRASSNGISVQRVQARRTAAPRHPARPNVSTQHDKVMPGRTPIPIPGASLEHEFAQERAAALGRHGRALEAALRELFELDLAHVHSEHSAEHRALRAALVEQASVALWQFIVQREACGLQDM